MSTYHTFVPVQTSKINKNFKTGWLLLVDDHVPQNNEPRLTLALRVAK